jgi:Kdo2-lipid IVA lauroyltransferase/acyltransferase
MQTAIYIVQAALLQLLMWIFAILPLDTASAFGGWIGRTIGPLLGASKRAGRHLEIAFPGMPTEEKKKITRDMWENIGRNLAEYPHLAQIGRERLTIHNEHIIKDVIAAGNGGVFFSAHVGNWEAPVPGMLARYGVAASLTYRALNNTYADNILRRYRTLAEKIKAYPKARESGKLLISDLKNKGYLAILIDQKYNEGVAVPFFGRPAMTNPIFIELAQKYKCPVIPVRCKRVNGVHFEITLHEPLKINRTEQALAEAHSILESWIKDAPEQWLWLHRRWKSEQLKTN